MNAVPGSAPLALFPAMHMGVDLVAVASVQVSIEAFGRRYLERVFTAGERDDASGRPSALAVRFAAKEAVIKALDLGDGPFVLQDIEVVRAITGRPELRLHRRAARRAHELGLVHASVSLSHEADMAVAVVVLQGGGQIACDDGLGAEAVWPGS